MPKLLKWLIGVIVILLLGFAGLVMYVNTIFDFNAGEQYSTNDLIENYTAKSREIEALQHYVNQKVRPSQQVEIEFEDEHTLTLFHVNEAGTWDSHWEVKRHSEVSGKLLAKLAWTEGTLDTLKDMLDKANCISVRSGEPCQIGFKRSGMGMFFYNLFTQPIADSLKSRYNDSCTYIYYNKHVVLEYGGGAIGPQCFPKTRH